MRNYYTIFLTLGITLIAQFATAASDPKKSRFDSRIQTETYNAMDVTEIRVSDGFAAVVLFAPDERIINKGSGFSDGWSLEDRENEIYIKPISVKVESTDGEVWLEPTLKEWDTNLLISTNRRNYVFDLILEADPKKSAYQISFKYPQDEKKQQQIKQQIKQLEKQAIDEQNKIETALNMTRTPRNWDYFMKVKDGSETIAPDYAYDDGLFTYLGFTRTKSFPSVFLLEGETESLLNTHVREDSRYQVLVVQKTAEKLVLRSGDKVVGIFNGSYGKNPAPYNTTISDKVMRDVK